MVGKGANAQINARQIEALPGTQLAADGDFPAWSQDLYQALLTADIEELKEGADA